MAFPVNAPFNSFHLEVGEGHRLYAAEFGNPTGFPVVYLHGGPGGGHSPAWQKYFNPDFYRIILFDQRGCGESTPFASIENNSIETLVSDIEKIREHLQIEKWAVGGGSWGSFLSLYYSHLHPERVQHQFLRGVFFATARGAAHIAEEGGAQPLDAKYFAEYRDFIPKAVRERDGLIVPYDRVMRDGVLELKLEAARRFMAWDTSIAFRRLSDAIPVIDAINKDPRTEIPITAIFMHFAVRCFKDDYESVILNSTNLQALPMDIIHGRHDRICPVGNAIKLKQAFPQANLKICEWAGHSGMDKGMVGAHVQATERLRRTLGG